MGDLILIKSISYDRTCEHEPDRWGQTEWGVDHDKLRTILEDFSELLAEDMVNFVALRIKQEIQAYSNVFKINIWLYLQ